MDSIPSFVGGESIVFWERTVNVLCKKGAITFWRVRTTYTALMAYVHCFDICFVKVSTSLLVSTITSQIHLLFDGSGNRVTAVGKQIQTRVSFLFSFLSGMIARTSIVKKEKEQEEEEEEKCE